VGLADPRMYPDVARAGRRGWGDSRLHRRADLRRSDWLSLAYSLWEGILCVSMSITMLAWFRRRFDHQGRLARTMSESAFAVYILHPAIIVPLALALSGMEQNLSVKYLVVAPIAVALCYLVAYGLRKVPFVRLILG
jgi:glucan biosynthesis protein C